MQNIQTGQQIWFPNVEELIRYLQAEYCITEDLGSAESQSTSGMDGLPGPGIVDLEE